MDVYEKATRTCKENSHCTLLYKIICTAMLTCIKYLQCLKCVQLAALIYCIQLKIKFMFLKWISSTIHTTNWLEAYEYNLSSDLILAFWIFIWYSHELSWLICAYNRYLFSMWLLQE